jgi:TetR/AcrR family transcriptional repressor of nem operon
MGRTSDARERLLNAAMELIYIHGYQGVGVEDLCKRAGVKKGSFYYFFRSKRDLALAAVDLRWKLTKEHMVERILGADERPLQRIQRFFEALGQAVANEKATMGRCGGCAFGNLAAEMSSRDARIRGRVRKIFDELTSHLERVLTEALHCGDLEGIDPAQNARALVVFMEGLLLWSKTYDEPSEVRRLGCRAVHLAGARETLPALS